MLVVTSILEEPHASIFMAEANELIHVGCTWTVEESGQGKQEDFILWSIGYRPCDLCGVAAHKIIISVI
jgi:hypothetical protein